MSARSIGVQSVKRALRSAAGASHGAFALRCVPHRDSVNERRQQMAVKIEASEKPLQKVFSSDYDFFIPLYQRPYAWTLKESGELFSDLVDNMGPDGTSIEETNPYFLGSVVLVKGATHHMPMLLMGSNG
ncbi:MAG: hypothetical protein DMG72_08660 [Acidobacteria bacterium]|nr:MAG: hypothetical protein DMG72_08660 [Acidobacteriota bacterium]